jgi:hypothetical protein
MDAPGDWFGTTRLDALNDQHLNIRSYYPFSKTASAQR